MTALANETPTQRALTTLKFARGMLSDLLKDIPADKANWQPAPTDNHVLWTVGHMASTYFWFIDLFGGTAPALPESYNTLFGWGSKPVSDPKAYPPLAEVRRNAEATFAAFLALVEAAPESDMTKPPVKDTGGFARDRLDLVEKAAWHEGWHSGQVSSIRRALGLKPLMG